MAVHVEWESESQRMARDHQDTTKPLAGGAISVCTECGKTWPARFGKGAATVRIVSKREGA